jgi:hypothetical protein
LWSYELKQQLFCSSDRKLFFIKNIFKKFQKKFLKIRYLSL